MLDHRKRAQSRHTAPCVNVRGQDLERAAQEARAQVPISNGVVRHAHAVVTAATRAIEL
jgi:hypothetical protein